MPAVGKPCVQSPEDLRNAQRRLRHGLGKISAWRRHSAYNTYRADFVIEQYTSACPFVEFSETARKICRVSFFARHLLQAAAYLAHCFGPARSAVSHQRNIISLVTVIFSKRYSCIYRCFPCSDRHVASIRDEYCSLHKRLS